MKASTILLAGALALTPAIASANYRYDFNLTAGVQGQTGNFSFTSPDLILNNLLISTSTFTSCNLYASNGSALACGANIGFYNDTTQLTSANDDYYDAISFGTGELGGSVTYFGNGCFHAPGICNSNAVNLTSNAGVLTISQVAAAVPELATWAMIIVGMGAIGVAMRRRRTSATVQFA